MGIGSCRVKGKIKVFSCSYSFYTLSTPIHQPPDQIMSIENLSLNPSLCHSWPFFVRKELEEILRLYGRKVASSEWADYGLEQSSQSVAFLIYKRSGEAPLYRIEKRPHLSQKQGAFALINAQGQVLKRGCDLGPVLMPLQIDRLKPL